MNGTTGKSPAKDDDETVVSPEKQPSTREVSIHESETGADVDPGRTPGKAEGVDHPEIEGNQ